MEAGDILKLGRIVNIYIYKYINILKSKEYAVIEYRDEAGKINSI